MANTAKTPKATAAKPAVKAPTPAPEMVKAAAEPAPVPVMKVEKIVAKPVAPPVVKAEAIIAAPVAAAKKFVETPTAIYSEMIKSMAKRPRIGFADYEELVQLGKDNVEAFLKSSSIVVKGVQDMTASLAGMARESIEDSVAASKALIGAKSVKEMMDLSSSLAKSNIDKMVSEGTKLSQLSSRLTQSALDPINKRVTHVVDRLTKHAPV
jgi:phasin family protein